MRDRQEVLDRFRELADRYLRERKDRYLSRFPINCQHNVRLRVKGKGHLGFCQNPLVLAKCGQRMFSCNDANTAQRCRVFVCRSTEATVEAEFKEILGSPARCGNEYPKLAMLIWFLQDFDIHGRWVRLVQSAKRAISSFWGLVTFRWW